MCLRFFVASTLNVTYSKLRINVQFDISPHRSIIDGNLKQRNIHMSWAVYQTTRELGKLNTEDTHPLQRADDNADTTLTSTLISGKWFEEILYINHIQVKKIIYISRFTKFIIIYFAAPQNTCVVKEFW